MQNKNVPYHALPLIAPQSIIFARLPFMLREREGAPRCLRLGALGLIELVVPVLLMGYLGRGYAYSHLALFDVASGRTHLQAIYQHPIFDRCPYGRADDYSPRVDMEVAAYIQAHTAPEETVFVWGFEPTIYFLSQRACASRFIYNYPLYGRYPWPELRDECLMELERRPPRYIVVVRNDSIPWVTGTTDDSQQALAGFEGLVRLMTRRYELETAIEDMTLYRRKD